MTIHSVNGLAVKVNEVHKDYLRDAQDFFYLISHEHSHSSYMAQNKDVCVNQLFWNRKTKQTLFLELQTNVHKMHILLLESG